MDSAVAALIGAGIGSSITAVGWTISGHQRVTEALTEERRTSYAALLLEADRVNAIWITANDEPADGDTAQGKRADPDLSKLRELITNAEFISSVRLRRSGMITQLASAVTTRDWTTERERFITVTRLESVDNAATLRWWHRRWYVRDSTVPKR